MVRNSEVSWDMTMLFQYYAAIKANVSEELLVTLKQLSRYIKEKAGTPETKWQDMSTTLQFFFKAAYKIVHLNVH